ncbi:hypothetical protein EV643_13129 [Kribbella sp. VKM Ac-2527]|uniref:Uncharacterized protein n=1 Tax=Kribbella caucasensis TaxID=2512215 RepID=A0A4R6JDV5_9ACTN|nr:hypothetical protein [Kribbella sp. VKM Ac-2527]TDO33762.1 hypothetical protein EV643_13129 [Kribbella sp. VKM Ac-2527]
MNSTVTGAVATYLAQIRAELNDLPPGELEDVLDDVSGHLTEVAAEFDGEPTAAALQERLGTPREYADELRSAAGYPPRTHSMDHASAQASAGQALRWGVIAGTVGPFFLVVGIFSWSRDASAFFGLIGLAVLFGAAYLGVRALRGNDPRTVLDTPRGVAAANSIRELIQQLPPHLRQELVAIGQPVWWVARGVVGGGGFFALFGAGAVTVVGALAGAAVSIWIGRRTQQDRRWLWYLVPLNVVAAVAVPAGLAASFILGSNGPFLFSNGDDSRGRSSGYNYQNGLTLDGEQITNIYPFDEQGRQVKVLLYTQSGAALRLDLQDCATLYPGTESHSGVSNFFPLPEVQHDPNGTTDAENCKDSTKAPFTPRLAPTTTPTPTPSTPSPKPSSGVTLTVSPTR